MLGAAIRRSLSRANTRFFQVTERMAWNDLRLLEKQFHRQIRAFFLSLNSEEKWEIYWACGVCTMGSSDELANRDTKVLRIFLKALAACEFKKMSCGCFGFASSAGALYAECGDYVISENSEITTSTPYGRAKYDQELLLREFATRYAALDVVISRFSTLYGPGQSLVKPQGLIAQIIRDSLFGGVTEIFVPLDTMRDYIFVDDAAELFIAHARRAQALSEGVLVKIISSERSVPISGVIGTIKSVLRRPVRIVVSRKAESKLYRHRVNFRSILRGGIDVNLRRYSLSEGVSVLLRSELFSHVSGNETVSGYGSRI
jgi:UDP-glucose 4-epimerase